jgi:two-component system response regulator AtoC
MADGGTIFLDEIGDMSPKLQVKLLRVLQEKKVEPVGSTKSIKVDVKIIAATHKDLKEEVKAGRFREDLYYRLQVIPFNIPALRERDGDILCLAKYFTKKFCSQFGFDQLTLSPCFLSAVNSYSWPGNVRELENLIERLVVMAESDTLTAEVLPDYITGNSSKSIGTPTEIIEIPEDGLDFNDLVNKYENHLITLALRHTQGNKKAAAKILKLNRTTLVEKIKKKGLADKIEVVVKPQVDSLFTP